MVNEYTDNQTVVHLHKGILISNHKELIAPTCDNLKSQSFYAKLKTPFS